MFVYVNQFQVVGLRWFWFGTFALGNPLAMCAWTNFAALGLNYFNVAFTLPFCGICLVTTFSQTLATWMQIEA